MLIDARSIPTGEVIESEVCIVGAGPAGVTLARELANQNFRVCLLESGGVDLDEKTQSLRQGESEGNVFGTLEGERRFQFGGTSNAWKIRIGENQLGVRYLPLDKIDFEKRDWLPYSGWCFDKAHLDPFYDRAQKVCQLGAFAYNAEAWENSDNPRLPLGNNVVTSMFQFGSRAIFNGEYREEIERASNITTYINANLANIETDETGKIVSRVEVACISGNKFWVCAKVFILSAGGIENARLLLLSNKVQKTGLGNQNDVVGRYFMEHPLVRCGTLIPSNLNIFQKTGLYDLRRVNKTPVMGKLSLSEETMRREHLLNISAILFPIPKPYQTQAVNSLKALRGIRHNSEVRKNAFKHFANLTLGLDYILPAAYGAITKQEPFVPSLAWGGWSASSHLQKRFAAFDVLHQTEQAPHPDNRITLMDDRDCLGRPKAHLSWRWRDIDIDTIKRSQDILKAEFAHAGIGDLQISRDGDLPELMHPGTNHLMGTTRMHDDPKQGVVDKNCQVHGVSNLFIAGSSVFPTGGFANPTLTIVALAIRLGDRVKTIL
jgi:choline dehydrogenase-like flavoprotein